MAACTRVAAYKICLTRIVAGRRAVG